MITGCFYETSLRFFHLCINIEANKDIELLNYWFLHSSALKYHTPSRHRTSTMWQLAPNVGHVCAVELKKFNRIWSSVWSNDWWSYQKWEELWRVNSRLLQWVLNLGKKQLTIASRWESRRSTRGTKIKFFIKQKNFYSFNIIKTLLN